jgi:lambda family phage tail tape measure protein
MKGTKMVDDIDQGTDLPSLSDALQSVSDISSVLTDDMQNLKQELGDLSKSASEFSVSFKSDISRAMKDVLVNGESMATALRGLALSMADKSLNAALNPIAEMASKSITNSIGNLFAFADGAAIQGGNVKAFASGGVVNGPSLFPMSHGTGLMGEAGPEAIMPLKRGSDGKLGVAASSDQRPIHVSFNIQTPDVQGFQKSKAQISADIQRALNHKQ